MSKHTTRPTTPTPWPGGVIARYLTVGGATVDITDHVTRYESGVSHRLHAACTGELCGREDRPLHGGHWLATSENPADDDGYYHALRGLQRWAQAHAEKCRAMPRPEAT